MGGMLSDAGIVRSMVPQAWIKRLRYLLRVLLLKLVHKITQLFYAGHRHRVVYGSPDAADRAMAFQIGHAALLRAFDKLHGQFFRRQAKRYVHHRAAARL